ncbi:hypothetical protein D3C80_1057300 [compost metagenome]
MSTNKQALREPVIIDISKHPLIKQAYEVCQAIEKCGASTELTDAVTKASALMQEIANAMARLGELEAAEKRIAELSAPDGNAIAWESTTPVYVKFITDERYQKLRPGYQKWYKPYRCSNCAAGISVKGE